MSPTKKSEGMPNILETYKGEYRIPLLPSEKSHDYFNFHHGWHGNKAREQELSIQ